MKTIQQYATNACIKIENKAEKLVLNKITEDLFLDIEHNIWDDVNNLGGNIRNNIRNSFNPHNNEIIWK